MKKLMHFWRDIKTLPSREQSKLLRRGFSFIYPDRMYTKDYTRELAMCVLNKDREGMIAAYDAMERDGIIDYMRTLALTGRQGDPIDEYDKTVQSPTDDD